MGEEFGHLLQALLDVQGLQDFLLLFWLDVEEVGYQVRQQARGVGGLHRRAQLGGHVGHELEGLFDFALEVLHARLELLVQFHFRLFQVLHPRQEVGVAVDELADAEAAQALDDDVVAALLGGDVSEDGRLGADGVEVVGTGFLHRRVLLLDDAQGAFVLGRLLGGGDGTFAAHGEGQDHAGIDHGATHREDDEAVLRRGPGGFFGGGVWGAGLFVHGVFLGQATLRRVMAKQPYCHSLPSSS